MKSFDPGQRHLASVPLINRERDKPWLEYKQNCTKLVTDALGQKTQNTVFLCWNYTHYFSYSIYTGKKQVVPQNPTVNGNVMDKKLNQSFKKRKKKKIKRTIDRITVHWCCPNNIAIVTQRKRERVFLSWGSPGRGQGAGAAGMYQIISPGTRGV